MAARYDAVAGYLSYLQIVLTAANDCLCTLGGFFFSKTLLPLLLLLDGGAVLSAIDYPLRRAVNAECVQVQVFPER